ncbi:hypothetical protein ACH35V_17680 [Actinomadura sp. 1N219]|uniref:hypothetical protein n=1 Tax=Actinomadura sp. 1N219 TaxID=3375152 RepID=UPI0037AED5CB
MLPSPSGKPAPPPDTTATLRAFAHDLGRRSPRTREAARFLTDLFDQLTATWNTGQATRRDDPLRGALARGGGCRASHVLHVVVVLSLTAYIPGF